jgi:hypothetical protein
MPLNVPLRIAHLYRRKNAISRKRSGESVCSCSRPLSESVQQIRLVDGRRATLQVRTPVNGIDWQVEGGASQGTVTDGVLAVAPSRRNPLDQRVAEVGRGLFAEIDVAHGNGPYGGLDND